MGDELDIVDDFFLKGKKIAKRVCKQDKETGGSVILMTAIEASESDCDIDVYFGGTPDMIVKLIVGFVAQLPFDILLELGRSVSLEFLKRRATASSPPENETIH